MGHSFFAYIARMKYIGRWGLMRSTVPENIQEHSHMVAVLAHALAVIRRDKFGGTIDPGHVAAVALYHDAPEIFTGDLPTPVKYHSSELRQAYKQLEGLASRRLTAMLPADIRGAFAPYLMEGEQDYAHLVVKAADRISAYLKCVEEQRAGNHEFDAAGENVLAAIRETGLEEVDDFMREFAPSFSLTLDELNNPTEDVP